MAKKGKTVEDREYIVFHRSLLEAGMEYSSSSRANYFETMIEYALHGELPKGWKIDVLVRHSWPLVKKELDRGIVKFLNGSKGGAPTGNQNAKKEKKDDLGL
ncbi:MAG: hypothetical protein J5382_04610 [Bacteroidales bacterium]|nr:hypothetical protein [Bacteroidales bacterium]